MTTSSSKRRSAANSPPATAIEADPLRWIWLALISGLYFIRWWKPTEGTLLGDTLDIAVGWFPALALAGWLGLRGTVWRVRWDALQWSVCLLAGGHVLSGLMVVATSGDRRAAVNLIWEWVSLGIAFPLLRSALTRPAARREWLIVSLAAAVTLSAYGLTQRHMFYPQMIVQYERVRDELDQLEQAAATGDMSRLPRMQKLRTELLGNGLSPHMLSGPGRVMFEGRLKHSSEALGRFALANTFAGLLLVWWALLVFQAIQQWQTRPVEVGEAKDSRSRIRENSDTPTSSPPKSYDSGYEASPQRETKAASGLVTGPISRLLVMLVCTLAVGYCLLLTKSRTAYVGGLASLLVWTFASQWRWQLSRRQLLIGVACVVTGIGGLILLAGMTGGLDRLVLAESSKSLQYRLEYWWSSLQVIRESPLLGVGPGQFRQHYLAHKLPRSSEEIADPHNLVLDVWANGGVLALVGLMGVVHVLGGEVRRVLLRNLQRRAVVLRRKQPIPATITLARTVRESGTAPCVVQKNPQPRRTQRTGTVEADILATVPGGWASPLRWGALGSLLILWLLGGGLESSLLGGLVSWLLLLLVLDKILPTALLEPLCWAAAGLGLLTHLCGAGGIAMPAISQLLLVIAIMVTSESVRRLPKRLPNWGHWVALWAGVGLFAAGYATAVRPVNLVKGCREQADVAKLPSQQERLHRQATLADPLASEPWERLAELAFQKWRAAADPDELDFRQAVEAQQHALDRNPLSFHTQRSLAMFHTEHARVSGSQADKSLAVREMRLAVARYPHHAELLADAAETYHVAGEPELAGQTARQSLEQDDINHRAGHTDKWLAERVRQRMVKLSAKPESTGVQIPP